MTNALKRKIAALTLSIRYETAWLKLQKALCDVRNTLREEKYRADQPRAPKGTPIGGQWVLDPTSARQQALAQERTRVAWMPMGFRKHGIDQVINRGISAEAILDALNNPVKILPGSSPYSWKYYGAQAVVVINPFGEIVTVWPN